jgi:hypothetical protein
MPGECAEEAPPPGGGGVKRFKIQDMEKDKTMWLMTLPVVSREEAQERGYVSITTIFDYTAEPDVVEGMERTMKGVDAVWIVGMSNSHRVCELGRKRNEVNRLLDGDGRMLVKGWDQRHAYTEGRAEAGC